MADSQVPWGVGALGGTISEPAWQNKPSWYLVTTEDRMIPPAAQREMSARAGATVIEVAGSHSIYVSKPEAVAELIQFGNQRDHPCRGRRFELAAQSGLARSTPRAGGRSKPPARVHHVGIARRRGASTLNRETGELT